MYLKWLMGKSSIARVVHKALICLLCLTFLLITGCSLLPKDSADEVIPTINPPKIAEKPTYVVKTDTLMTTVQASGQVMAAKEQSLYFILDGKRLKDVYVQTGDKVKKGQMLAEVDVSDVESDLRQLILQNSQSELAMKQLLRGGDTDSNALEQAKLNFEQQRQTLLNDRDTIAKAKLTAPFDGTIAAVYARKGDSISAYSSIAVIADLSKLTVAVSISQADLKRVAVGMDADVNMNGAGQLHGKVMQLPDMQSMQNQNNSNQQQGGSAQDDIANYLLIRLDQMPANVVRGTPLSATIIIQKREHVIVVPPSVIRTNGARNYVRVIDGNGNKREVDVEVGQRTATVIEIIKGLTVGQKVEGQ